uniref:Uncharacterized protein n=1 Tax=Anopheles merus TaxID=30066 RepID=A0A182UT54_ANOME
MATTKERRQIVEPSSIFGLWSSIGAPVPTLASGGADSTINPFIRYWEPARFDRGLLDVAHQHHEQHRRRRRSINYEHGSAAYGPANVVRLNFRAHDREFRLVLREDPRSVFSRDVQIENTEGPLDYDLSRIYTGTVEEQRATTDDDDDDDDYYYEDNDDDDPAWQAVATGNGAE